MLCLRRQFAGVRVLGGCAAYFLLLPSEGKGKRREPEAQERSMGQVGDIGGW